MNNLLPAALAVATVVAIGSYTGAAAGEGSVPAWVRSTAQIWVDGDIGDGTFLTVIQFLLDEGLVSPPEQAANTKKPTINEGPPPSGPDAKIADAGDFYVSYGPNPNSLYDDSETAEVWLRSQDLLEAEAEFLNEYFPLPHDVEIVAEECGEINAFYEPNMTQVVLCYEYVDNLFDVLYHFEPEADDDAVRDYVTSELTYTLHHEMAHALIHIHDLRFVGMEENAADQFATLMLLYRDDGSGDYTVGQDMLRNVIINYSYQDAYKTDYCQDAEDDEEYCDPGYWGIHALDVQRHHNTACWAYGSDPEYNSDFLELGWVHADRAADCEVEFQDMDRGWAALLEDYTDGFYWIEWIDS